MSSHAFAYNGLELDSETIVSSAGTNVIDRSHDSLGRNVAAALRAASAPDPEYQVSYAYDSFGRFAAITSSVQSVLSVVNYSYLPNSDLIQQSTVNGLQSTRSYEPHRNLLTQIKNSLGSETISQYSYANDALGRRISAGWSGSAFSEMGSTVMRYGYNTRSEVISAERFFGSDPLSPGAPVAGQNWDYDFDPIGNRKTAARDGDIEVYTANNLNQYTERTVSGVAQVAGTAAEDATVTINRPSISGITVEPVTRQGAYFHKKLSLDNSAGADVEEIAVVGVLGGAHSTSSGQVDIVSTYSGVVWAAQSPERFSYDADGNMLADAVRKYEWDGENRLTAVTISNVVDGSLKRVEMAYDYMSRRSLKKEYKWVNGQWSMVSSRSFLWNGWNMIREVCAATGRGTITDYYIWGLDLSGSLQGAGGIGGLIGRVRSENRYYDEQGMLLICHKPPGNPENEQTLRINESAWPAHEAHGDTLGACAGGSVSNSAFLYTFDGNGNVSELLQSTAYSPQPALVGHYEYSPFGETIVATGPEAQDNPFRFSTKYFVAELGIGDWGRRWYLPSLGRWLSGDPMEEDGSTKRQLFVANNEYLFCRNNPVEYIDYFGLFDVDWSSDALAGCDGGYLRIHYGFTMAIQNLAVAHITCWTAGGSALQLCDTTTYIRIKASSKCCRQYSVACSYTFTYHWRSARERGAHAEAKGKILDTPIVQTSGYDVIVAGSWSDTRSMIIDIDSTPQNVLFVQGLGGAYPNSWGLGAAFTETISGYCSALDTGPCPRQ